jgi:tRNA threonylcarbamoyladenosine biosynthesis protein TsaE
VSSDEVIVLADEAATTALGARLASLLRRGDVVCLWGALGSGKSTLARGLIRALTGPDEPVPSPTFTLIQTYDGPQFALAHLDLYRLKTAREIEEIGLEDALDEGAVLIEWPERLEGDLPADRLDIVFASPDGRLGRRVRLLPHGDWKERALEA